MIDVTRIQKALQALTDSYFPANPEDEFRDNIIGHSIRIHSDVSGCFSADFYYSENQDLYSFHDIDDLEHALKEIEQGDSYMLGLEFEHDNT